MNDNQQLTLERFAVGFVAIAVLILSALVVFVADMWLISFLLIWAIGLLILTGFIFYALMDAE